MYQENGKVLYSEEFHHLYCLLNIITGRTNLWYGNLLKNIHFEDREGDGTLTSRWTL
jgi:hypothetical protein